MQALAAGGDVSMIARYRHTFGTPAPGVPAPHAHSIGWIADIKYRQAGSVEDNVGVIALDLHINRAAAPGWGGRPLTWQERLHAGRRGTSRRECYNEKQTEQECPK